MRKVLILLCIISANIFALEPGETQIQTKTWLRFGHVTQDGTTEQSGFEVARGYLVWAHQFTGNIGTKVNVDMYSSDKDSDANGAGLKLRAALVEFGGLVPDAKLNVGLVKHYFGFIYDYDYRIIEMDPADLYGYASSSDYGIALDGYIPKGYGTYQFGIYNGEGYKKPPSENDNNYEFLGNVRVIPIAGLTLGGTITFTQNDDPASEDMNEPDKLSDMRIAGVIRGAYGPVDIWAQYLMRNQAMGDDIDNHKGNVISVMPSVRVLDGLEVIGRYDINDPNNDLDDDETTLLVAGINYALSKDSKGNPNLLLQGQFEQINDSDDDTEPVNQIRLQIQYSFKSNPF